MYFVLGVFFFGGGRGGPVVLTAGEAEIRDGTEGGGHLQSGRSQFSENTAL